MSLLLDALRRAEDARDRARGIAPRQRENPVAAPASPRAAPASRKPGPLFALGLAAAIFAGAVLAWHAQPWRAPTKTKVDATSLKLDRELKMKPDPGAASGGVGTSRP